MGPWTTGLTVLFRVFLAIGIAANLATFLAFLPISWISGAARFFCLVAAGTLSPLILLVIGACVADRKMRKSRWPVRLHNTMGWAAVLNISHYAVWMVYWMIGDLFLS